MKFERVRAVDISNTLQDVMQNAGLSLSHLRSQEYGEASTTSGYRVVYRSC